MIRTLFFVVLGIVILSFIFNGSFIANAKNKGKQVYTITVYNFGVKGGDTYLSDSIISQDANKIIFIDAFNRKQIVTGNGITVTQY